MRRAAGFVPEAVIRSRTSCSQCAAYVFPQPHMCGVKVRALVPDHGDGGFKGKRALLCVTVGGPAEDYSARGINGPLEQLLFPITHGTLFFPGMDVLPTYAVYGTGSITAEGVAAAKATWRLRLEHLFEDAPIPFRPQNGGSYPDGHVLASHVAVGQSGLPAHVAENASHPAITSSPARG